MPRSSIRSPHRIFHLSFKGWKDLLNRYEDDCVYLDRQSGPHTEYSISDSKKDGNTYSTDIISSSLLNSTIII